MSRFSLITKKENYHFRDFNYAKNFVPSGQLMSIDEIQSPLIQDNLGIKDTWHLIPSP